MIDFTEQISEQYSGICIWSSKAITLTRLSLLTRLLSFTGCLKNLRIEKCKSAKVSKDFRLKIVKN